MGRSADPDEHRVDETILKPTPVRVDDQHGNHDRDEQAAEEGSTEPGGLTVDRLDLHPADHVSDRMTHDAHQHRLVNPKDGGDQQGLHQGVSPSEEEMADPQAEKPVDEQRHDAARDPGQGSSVRFWPTESTPGIVVLGWL